MVDSDLIAFLVALNTGAGVHLGNAPQDAPYPVVVVRNAGSRQRMTTQGTPLFHQPTFAIHVLHHGLTPQGTGGYDDALPIAWTIHDALRSLRGMMGDTRVAVTRITSAPRDISEIEGDKVTRWLQQDVVITHY
jgi:hypothetical protein